MTIQPCTCGSGFDSSWQYDGRGIPLCRTCPACHESKMSQYRPEIFNYYDQTDVDETIEGDEEDRW